MNQEAMIHKSAEVKTSNIGQRTKIWQSVIILEKAAIGSDVNICAHCFIENDVIIGDRVTVKSGVYLWDGVRLQDDVFVGPNVTFTNDKYPRSKVYPDEVLSTCVEKGATIGGGAVLLPGITIGRGAMVGAGAIVTKSVPPYAIVAGSPARITGYIDSKNAENQGAKTTFQFPSESKENTIRIGIGNVTLHRLKRVNDMRGDLSAGEFLSDIPFTPKRYFLVFNVPSEKTRGEHAHHRCHQFLICVKGRCSVVVDDGKSRSEVVLETPDLGIHLPPMTWGIQYKYSSDAVLLVFASEHYDASDYIRNYSEFFSLIEAQNR